MLSKILGWSLGLLLIPIDVGYAIAFSDQLFALREVRAPELHFLLGITAYLAFHVLIAPPTRAYVFGHEMMHAAATWISGGQVKGFKVGSKKGAVTTNKVTAFIALAPYLIPVYAVLWAFGFGAASLFWNTTRWTSWFFFGLGAALAFHLVFTVDVLKQKQSDLEITGPLLALALIFFGNLALIIGAMSLVVPEIQFLPYLGQGYHHSLGLYQAIFHQLFVQ